MGRLADYLIENDPNFRKGRLPALYSDFRSQKTLNPDGYQANIAAWSGALSRLASQGLLSHQGSKSSLLVLDLDESIRRSLDNKQYGQPMALGAVVNDAVANKNLIPLQSFLQSQQPIYQQTWSQVPWNVMGWTLRQIGVIDPSRGEDKVPKGQYVVMTNVEAASKEISDLTSEKVSRFDRIYTKAQFLVAFRTRLFTNQRISEADLDVLLRFLSRDKNIIDYDGETIRVRASGEENGITDDDAAMAAIKELTANLEHQVDLLNTRIEELDNEARTSVLKKNRIKALAALKAKKLAESSLTRRYTTLNQLEEVASKLQQATDQVQLVKVMESSAGALQTLNAKIGGTDRVESVMDRLREQMGDTDEVAAILAESTGVIVDEGEIDDELEALEKEQKEQEQVSQRAKEQTLGKETELKEAAEFQEKLDSLPTVPNDPITEGSAIGSPTSETRIADLALS